jgi:hypothetical protein
MGFIDIRWLSTFCVASSNFFTLDNLDSVTMSEKSQDTKTRGAFAVFVIHIRVERFF